MQKGITVLTAPIFTRLLSTSEYGQYSVFNSWYEIISIIVSLRLAYGMYSQGLVKFEDESAVFSSSLQGLTLTLCSAWTVLYLVFHQWFNTLLNLTTVQMLSLLTMVWATAVFDFWASEKKVRYDYRTLVAVTLVVSIAKPTVGIVFVLHADDKVTARVLGLALVELAGYGFGFIDQMKRGKVFFSKRFWKYALRFNLPLIPHYISMTVLSYSDRIMIGKLVGENEAGIYALAHSLAKIMSLVNAALTATVTPWIYRKMKEGKTGDISKVGYASIVLVAAANIMLIAFAPEAVAVFAPEEYYDAIYCIPPIAAGVFFVFLYDLFAQFEFYYEKPGYIMLASVIGAVLNIILNYVFINLCGYVAAAYTTLFCYFLFTVMHYVFMSKICRNYLSGIRPYNKKIIIGLSTAFLALGFTYLASYRNIAVRYTLTGILTLAAIINRKRIREKIKAFLSIAGHNGEDI